MSHIIVDVFLQERKAFIKYSQRNDLIISNSGIQRVKTKRKTENN